jgi:starvation-inducible outer membrane lipoprotein
MCPKKLMISKRSLIIFSLALLLIACNSFPSVNDDPVRNNKAAFQKDLAECKEDHPVSGTGLHYKRWAECMNLKGWK